MMGEGRHTVTHGAAQGTVAALPLCLYSLLHPQALLSMASLSPAKARVSQQLYKLSRR